MKEFIPITLRELGELVDVINELKMSKLSDEEKKIIDLIKSEKKETQKTLGRCLNEEEQIAIEVRKPGGWKLMGKLEDIAAQAVEEVKSRRIQ